MIFVVEAMVAVYGSVLADPFALVISQLHLLIPELTDRSALTFAIYSKGNNLKLVLLNLFILAHRKICIIDNF